MTPIPTPSPYEGEETPVPTPSPCKGEGKAKELTYRVVTSSIKRLTRIL